MADALKDRVVLVTGAAGGIGRALVEAFDAAGARLACHAFRQEAALRERTPERHLVVQADLRIPAEADAAFDAAVERFGRVDVCVANAGARPKDAAPLHEMDEARVRGTIESDLLAAVWTARAFLRALARTGGDGACLLLIGSTAAAFGERGWADYATAKAGLQGLLRTLKNEIVALDPRGRVNLIEPGWTVTHVPRPALEDEEAVRRALQTMPLRRLGRAEDVASAAVWLAQANHVTGQTITVAGGMEGRVLWE